MGAMLRHPLVALALVACSAPNIVLEGPGEDDTGQVTGETGAPPDETGDTGLEHIPGTSAYTQSDPLFQLDVVHAVEITMGSAAMDSLRSDPFTYVHADLSFDDDLVSDVGVRIKGRIGSYRDLSQKSAFKIDFNRYVDSQTYRALEKLNLNSMVQDNAQVHERIAYGLYRLAGLPAPRVGYAWVKVNGADFGLYTLVEAYDDVFLKGRYAEPDGNLYDGDYVWYGEYEYDKLDFVASLQDMYVLDEGQDVGHADIHAVTQALAASYGGASFDETMSAVVDMDQLIQMWAADTWVGHYDSYSFNQNNYRVYFDPQDGLADLLPWDPDWAFYDDTPITTPSGYLALGCQADPSCYQAFLVALGELCAAVQGSDLEEQLDQAQALIAPYVRADPRKETTAESAAAYQEAVRAWLYRRRGTMEAYFGI